MLLLTKSPAEKSGLFVIVAEALHHIVVLEVYLANWWPELRLKSELPAPAADADKAGKQVDPPHFLYINASWQAIETQAVLFHIQRKSAHRRLTIVVVPASWRKATISFAGTAGLKILNHIAF